MLACSPGRRECGRGRGSRVRRVCRPRDQRGLRLPAGGERGELSVGRGIAARPPPLNVGGGVDEVLARPSAVERGGRERGERASQDRPRHHVDGIVDAGMYARVGDQRGERLERDSGGREVVSDARGKREGRRRVTGGERRRARHVDVAGDRHVVRRAIGAAPASRRLEYQVHDAGGDGDRGQPADGGAAATRAGRRQETRDRRPRASTDRRRARAPRSRGRAQASGSPRSPRRRRRRALGSRAANAGRPRLPSRAAAAAPARVRGAVRASGPASRADGTSPGAG